MDAQTADFLVKVLSVLGLAILAIRDILRTRRERAERHDTGRLESIKARAEAEERRDGIIQGLLTQFARQADSLNGLTVEIGSLVKSELERNEIRQKADQGHDRAITGVTEAVGDLITQTGQVRKRADTLIEQVGLFPRQMANEHGLQQSAIIGQIKTAAGEAGKMFENKIDPVQAALDELRETLKDVQEKVNHIPELENCLNQTNLAMRVLAERTSEIVAKRDSALNDVQALRNALLFVDRQKVNSESELARLKEVVNPPLPPAVTQPATTSTTEAAQADGYIV